MEETENVKYGIEEKNFDERECILNLLFLIFINAS